MHFNRENYSGVVSVRLQEELERCTGWGARCHKGPMTSIWRDGRGEGGRHAIQL